MYPYEITTRLSELSLLDFSGQLVLGAVPGDFDPLEIERLRHMEMAYHVEQALLDRHSVTDHEVSSGSVPLQNQVGGFAADQLFQI